MKTDHGRTVHVHYYAQLREQSGLSDETVHAGAETLLDLFVELRERHHFAARPERLKVAVNAEFRNWDDTIHDGDTVVFLPPVAGG